MDDALASDESRGLSGLEIALFHLPLAIPEEARRLIDKLEIHYTPKHGSLLNMAETELRSRSRQCLDRRLPDLPTATVEVAAWETARNDDRCTVNWQFKTADARVKLKRLSPVIEPVR